MRNDLKGVRALAFDIDDTLSTDGKLTSDAFVALWQLRAAKFALVPITGRPAGWCDHIVRFWPVDAVVGENGAFTMVMQNGKIQEQGYAEAIYENPQSPYTQKLLGAILKT